MKLTIDEKKQPVAKSELLQVAEIVAKDKGFEKEEVLSALEEAMLPSARAKYGTNKNIVVHIERNTGNVLINWIRKVVDSVSDNETEISLNDARTFNKDTKIGDEISEALPNITFSRSMVQSARQIINQKMREAERKYQLKEFSNRIGDIIVGTINRIDYSNVILDIGRSEGVIRKSELIPNEPLKIGSRLKVLLCGLNQDSNVPLLRLSRTHPDFVKKLFAQEIPEVYDGIVTVVSVARDPGSKAKVAVTAADPSIDPVGACVGPKGIRIRTISDELRGEKIDVVKWSADPATFIVNSLAPAHPSKIVIDDTEKHVDAVIPDDQLSLAIGRRGQNVRLASKLTGWAINAITEKTATTKREKEQASIIANFKKSLDIDEELAERLVEEGYVSISEIANSTVDELTEIDGFDSEIALEISDRANLYIDNRTEQLVQLCKEKGVDEKLMNYELINPELLELLVKANIKTLDDLGDLSTEELLEISSGLLTQSEAESLIMEIRKTWF